VFDQSLFASVLPQHGNQKAEFATDGAVSVKLVLDRDLDAADALYGMATRSKSNAGAPSLCSSRPCRRAFPLLGKISNIAYPGPLSSIE
jgi:hypothetical protein